MSCHSSIAMKPSFYDYTLAEWQQWCQKHNLPAFRAKQIHAWQKRGLLDFAEMTDQSKQIRELLATEFVAAAVKKMYAFHSQVDQVAKYIFLLQDGNIIETVLMQYDYGNTICVTSQVGCRMGCDFCASAPLGLVRNLTSGEILAQVAVMQRLEQVKINNIVVMGIGEPLDNYEQTLKFIHQVHDEAGLNISLRKITLSTCGLVPAIERFAKEVLPVTLSLSLHAPNQQLREQLMPIAKAYDLETVLQAVDDYFQHTGRRITYEYALFAGINDSERHAHELARLVQKHRGHVNLIPANPVPGKDFFRSTKKEARRFKEILESYHLAATIRKSLGNDIEAACGQLRRDVLDQAESWRTDE